MPIVFSLVGMHGRVKCCAIYPYQRYWIDRALRIKNDNFDQNTSGRILTFKSGSGDRNFSSTVNHFASAILKVLRQEFDLERGEIFVIPSHKAGKVSDSLVTLARKINQLDAKFKYRHNGLVRQRDVAKLAHGGDRSIGVHRQSLSAAVKPFEQGAAPCIILDDVATSGNSILACHELLMGRGVPVFGVVLGRTVHD